MIIFLYNAIGGAITRALFKAPSHLQAASDAIDKACREYFGVL